jgi:cell division protein FtsZ
MPRIEELPVPAQNAIRASRGDVVDSGPEKQRMSLLQRLAQVGLGRREEGEAPAEPQKHANMPPVAERPQPRPVARGPEPVSDYAKRASTPQGLDLHGRQTPSVQKPVDDDQLDIPAFLRRQAN